MQKEQLWDSIHTHLHSEVYLIRLVGATIEKGGEHVDGDNLDLLQHIPSLLVQPLPCCDICEGEEGGGGGRGRREGEEGGGGGSTTATVEVGVT